MSIAYAQKMNKKRAFKPLKAHNTVHLFFHLLAQKACRNLNELNIRLTRRFILSVGKQRNRAHNVTGADYRKHCAYFKATGIGKLEGVLACSENEAVALFHIAFKHWRNALFNSFLFRYSGNGNNMIPVADSRRMTGLSLIHI